MYWSCSLFVWICSVRVVSAGQQQQERNFCYGWDGIDYFIRPSHRYEQYRYLSRIFCFKLRHRRNNKYFLPVCITHKKEGSIKKNLVSTSLQVLANSGQVTNTEEGAGILGMWESFITWERACRHLLHRTRRVRILTSNKPKKVHVKAKIREEFIYLVEKGGSEFDVKALIGSIVKGQIQIRRANQRECGKGSGTTNQ